MKAQISIDFIIIISIALILFLYIFSIVDKRNDELYSTRTQLYAKSVSDKLASNINSVFLAGDGLKKTILLQDTLKDNTGYTVNIYPTEHLVKITWDNRQYASPILTANIIGDLTSIKGYINIANLNGLININAEIIEPICGNNIQEGTEVCDGTDLAGESCQTQGFGAGTLACLPDCSAFDTSSCITSCQTACQNLAFSQWQCRNSCTGGWSNAAPEGDAYCSPQLCCCR